MPRTAPHSKEVSSLRCQWAEVNNPCSKRQWTPLFSFGAFGKKPKQNKVCPPGTHPELAVLFPTAQLRTGENKWDLGELASLLPMWPLLPPEQGLGQRDSVWAEEPIHTNGFQPRLHSTCVSFQIFYIFRIRILRIQTELVWDGVWVIFFKTPQTIPMCNQSQ